MRDRALQGPPDRSQSRSRIQTLQPGLSRTVCRARRRFSRRGDFLMNVPTERINALTTFGYTERESEFLYTVATFSGFFVQRQYAGYLGINGRGPVTDLIAKTLQKKHVREYRPEGGLRKIYHLFAHSLYAAIGKENSRNRRAG